ncbi:transmembrane protein, putative [Rhizoctonia solani AG-3 Rhs1AP]|uniref:Transmembrane protein, putative n=2 Tax=Rhizoctonia solani AG-3 TaxID=1086053 RepID=A0A0A1UK53_9AGAM|nr:transmembrane protein, putative [Rhizoctonia solani AG-3 Rhs1AP]KEP50449.1 putative transmembrane protein [Rhizoctonia solani 123E]
MSDAYTQPRREGNTPLIPNHGQTPGGTGNADLNAINAAQEDFDEYGAELRQDARVWKAYVKEADKFDSEQVDGWNRSLDVTLIFAALFTAICTAFVIESSKSLKEDLAETTARRLDQITGILLVVANVSDRSLLNPNEFTVPISPVPFSPRPVDVCVNVLWFFSLILSAAVSLFAMLAKEWCYLFMSGRIGDSWSQTKRRQQRWEGIETWKMEQVIMILPSFVHLSFLSFAIGLCIYLGDLNGHVAILASIVTFGSTFIYMASTLLPLLHLSDTICPYSTSVSRFVQRFREDTKGTEKGSEKPNRVAVGALAWLIKSSEDPKSTDVALQAIAGADPNDVDRQLLKDARADIMISRRLMRLNPRLANYGKVLDLYIRAHSFFGPSASVQPKPNSISSQTVLINVSPERVMESTGGYQKGLNKEPQKKIRDLRDMINQEITAYITSSSHTFLSTPDNILALRIGITAASHCLQSLQHGIQYRTKELFDSAIELLENYRNRTAHLNDREIEYLMTGTAMLLSSLLINCPPAAGARYVMRLLRITGRANFGQRKLHLEYLGLPLVVYALSRHDYSGWTQPPPLNPMSRAERAIEVIAYYTASALELSGVSLVMVNLALVELLSNPKGYSLEDEDIGIISEAFDPMVHCASQTQIHTLPTNPCRGRVTPTSRSMEKGILDRSREAVAGACLTVLNRTKTGHLTADTPLGQLYTLVIECVLGSSSLAPNRGDNHVMLNVMKRLHNCFDQEQVLTSSLPQALNRRKIIAKLKDAAEINVPSNGIRLVVKLFATGQAWFLINLAIKPGHANHKDWIKCLMPFVAYTNS